MSPDTNEIHIEEEGFITTKKGFTLSSMALFIWIATGILFKLSDTFFANIDYQTFCFFVSLLLSGLAGYFLTNRLVKNVSASSRLLLATANILLLYTSANGIQSGYCFISSPSQNQIASQSSLIPFLEAKPWLPDKFQANTIDELKTTNEQLEQRVIELQNFTGDKFELIKEIDGLNEQNRLLKDSLNRIQSGSGNQTDNSQLMQELERLKEENQRLQMTNEDLKRKLDQTTSEYSDLKNRYNVLREKCAKTSDDYKKLTDRVKEYNLLQSQWREKIGSPNYNSLRRNIITSFGNDFYKRFFETPISVE
jgi:hypothetical protein